MSLDSVLTVLAATGATVDKVGANATQKAQSDLTGNVATILNIVIGALGIVAVVVMIIGGINYMTSAGDAGKVDKGKKTIIYGLIGLVICALSFVIVNFVIVNILKNS